jgi:argonaute-like protein implicated in RNA metabolism and viral defense
MDRTRLDAQYYFGEVERMASSLSRLEYRNRDDFAFSISAEPAGILNSFRIHAPSYLFDYNPGASDDNASRGLTVHGPYDSSTFDVKYPKVLAVLHENHRGGFADFLGKLKSGIPSSRSFKSGLVGKYRLHDITFETVELGNYGLREYAEKIADYIREQDTLPDLAVVETKEEFRQLPSQSNPYYWVKAYLLSLGIPVQFIKNKNVRKPDHLLQWVCESVALQVYAKLGGRPWVLPASTSIDHEIVVGIGSSMLRRNLFAGSPQQRIVGITTFFTGDGRYIFGNRCKEIPFEQYFDELLSSLRSSIQDISADYNWRDGDTVRIVFHVFKPIKNVEAEVVAALLQEFAQYDIRYCFVTISDRNPFLLFDRHQKGVGPKKKGRYVPRRGTNWVLGPHACLLQLTGPDDIKSERHGFGNPVLVRIHEGSTFLDLNTIVQQISNFTHLSWRGFNAAQQPATVLYSELIAKNLSHMRKIKSWKPELINSLLRDKKWFL